MVLRSNSQQNVQLDRDAWNTILAGLSNPHILQSYEWGMVKSRFGWIPHYKLWKDKNGKVIAASLILERSISLGGMKDLFRVLYVPRGPILKDWHDVNLRRQILSDLAEIAYQRRAIFVKIDPGISIGTGIPGTSSYESNHLGEEFGKELRDSGWRISYEQVQFRNTVLIDLHLTEAELLAGMKQKTRYNIRLANRKGVSVRFGTTDDLDLLYQLYAETSIRDGFVIRDREYYLTLWETFFTANLAKPLIAEINGEPVAALVLFWFQKTAYYMFGMSRQIHREKMPNYLLQWEAIKMAKEVGSTFYDLWGAPDNFDVNDPMWGVYRFKEGLGGNVVNHIGAWDYPSRPYLYRLYIELLPRLLAMMRVRGKIRTRQILGV